MKRIAVFLEEKQIKKIKALAKELSKEANTPQSAILRQALDFYFAALKQEGIKPEEMPVLQDGRVSRSSLNSPQLRTHDRKESVTQHMPRNSRSEYRRKLLQAKF